METKTKTAKDVDRTVNKASYDLNAKQLIAEPDILANIMKLCVDEMADMSIEDIKASFEHICVSSVSPEPGETNMPEEGRPGTSPKRNVTDNPETLWKIDPNVFFNGEGESRFDILFVSCFLKDIDKTVQMRLYVDVEIQRKYSDDLVARSIFYGGRLLSTQYGVEVTKDTYGNLKKVYSVWLCLGCDEQNGNTITKYRIAKEDIYGEHTASSYDFLETIMVRVPEDTTELEKSHKLIYLVGTVLSDVLSGEQKKEILEKRFGIPMTEAIEGGINTMCDLSEKIEERTRTEAIQGLVETYKDFHGTCDQCVDRVSQTFRLTKDKAEKEVVKYW